ncbi:MAG TPA: glycolate oxidase subunit GlcF [Acetobacteraceae bacterium]|jgi:glycolate oxidase iron-sulfur subunit|nr:glycolate oxidase subunit GlcF [Acetobacteraceae bacterium]
MQTSFTPDQLRDPDTAVSNQVLRTCVHCGFCTATCPTFVLLGDELDSPRGRIYLIKDMLETGRPATQEVVTHIDRCLSCLSCMTTCPSGVNYMHLVDHARTYIERTYRRPWHERLLRGVLGTMLTRPDVFRAALLGARLARPFAQRLPGAGMLAQRLRAMLAMTPRHLPPPSATERPGVHRAQGERRGRVALLAGCAQQVLAPEINAATIRLLNRIGIEVVVPDGSGCCGALNHHMGQHETALDRVRGNVEAWSAEIEREGLDAIVINTSGCGTMLKDYGFLLRTAEEPWRSRAEKVSALALDISQFLARIGYSPTRPNPGLTIAYHAACSLQHGQGITQEPKMLLAAAGFTVVEPAEAHLCCGSAGTYNILQPAIAARLRARKLGNLRATRPDLIATGNVGCINQLRGGGLPVVHTVEVLDWMAGGPEPAPLADLAKAPA